MGQEKRFISVSELVEGMVIACDIEKNGNIIIKEGLKLTMSMIERLQRIICLDKVEVFDSSSNYEKNDNSEDEFVNKNILEFNRIEEEFNCISIQLKDTFHKIVSDREDFLDDIRLFAKRIEEVVKQNRLIVKNIVLYGSGSDVIYRHGVNVSALSALLGIWLGMSESQIKLLVYSAILHDCGKMKIDNDLIYKPRRLNDEEYNIIKKHSELGYNMVKKLRFIDKSVSYGVLMHHERMDGSGYPLGIQGDKIHPFGKIIAIADIFDAINSDRGYKSKKAPFEALSILREESLRKLDYSYVEVFLKHIINYYIGEEVLLNNGDRCKIIQMDINSIRRPLLLKDGEFIDLSEHKELYVKEMLL